MNSCARYGDERVFREVKSSDWDRHNAHAVHYVMLAMDLIAADQRLDRSVVGGWVEGYARRLIILTSIYAAWCFVDRFNYIFYTCPRVRAALMLNLHNSWPNQLTCTRHTRRRRRLLA